MHQSWLAGRAVLCPPSGIGRGVNIALPSCGGHSPSPRLWRTGGTARPTTHDRRISLGEKFGWFVPSRCDKLTFIVESTKDSFPIMRSAAGLPAAIPPDGAPDPLAWFAGMMEHCYDFAQAARTQGRPIVGI